jgi:hypothetical protein
MNYFFVPELQKLDKTERLVYLNTEVQNYRKRIKQKDRITKKLKYRISEI